MQCRLRCGKVGREKRGEGREPQPDGETDNARARPQTSEKKQNKKKEARGLKKVRTNETSWKRKLQGADALTGKTILHTEKNTAYDYGGRQGGVSKRHWWRYRRVHKSTERGTRYVTGGCSDRLAMTQGLFPLERQKIKEEETG